jgi:hypothetical protein
VAKLEQRTPTPASLDFSRMTDEELTAALLEDLRQILADPQSLPEELRHARTMLALPWDQREWSVEQLVTFRTEVHRCL